MTIPFISYSLFLVLLLEQFTVPADCSIIQGLRYSGTAKTLDPALHAAAETASMIPKSAVKGGTGVYIPQTLNADMAASNQLMKASRFNPKPQENLANGASRGGTGVFLPNNPQHVVQGFSKPPKYPSGDIGLVSSRLHRNFKSQVPPGFSTQKFAVNGKNGPTQLTREPKPYQMYREISEQHPNSRINTQDPSEEERLLGSSLLEEINKRG